jgi:hypothetical protein
MLQRRTRRDTGTQPPVPIHSNSTALVYLTPRLVITRCSTTSGGVTIPRWVSVPDRIPILPTKAGMLGSLPKFSVLLVFLLRFRPSRLGGAAGDFFAFCRRPLAIRGFCTPPAQFREVFSNRLIRHESDLSMMHGGRARKNPKIDLDMLGGRAYIVSCQTARAGVGSTHSSLTKLT